MSLWHLLANQLLEFLLIDNLHLMLLCLIYLGSGMLTLHQIVGSAAHTRSSSATELFDQLFGLISDIKCEFTSYDK